MHQQRCNRFNQDFAFARACPAEAGKHMKNL